MCKIRVGSTGSFQFNGDSRFCLRPSHPSFPPHLHLQAGVVDAQSLQARDVASLFSKKGFLHPLSLPPLCSRCLPWSASPAAGKRSSNGPLVDGACQIVTPDPCPPPKLLPPSFMSPPIASPAGTLCRAPRLRGSRVAAASHNHGAGQINSRLVFSYIAPA